MKLQAAAALKNGFVGEGAARRTRGVEWTGLDCRR